MRSKVTRWTTRIREAKIPDSSSKWADLITAIPLYFASKPGWSAYCYLLQSFPLTLMKFPVQEENCYLKNFSGTAGTSNVRRRLKNDCSLNIRLVTFRLTVHNKGFKKVSGCPLGKYVKSKRGIYDQKRFQ